MQHGLLFEEQRLIIPKSIKEGILQKLHLAPEEIKLAKDSICQVNSEMPKNVGTHEIPKLVWVLVKSFIMRRKRSFYNC